MRPKMLVLLLLLVLLVAGCSPPGSAPAATLQATEGAPPLSTSSPTPSPEPSPTSEPTATPAPTATPTPAPGDLPITADTLGQLRILWQRDDAVEGSDSGCYLTDCLAPSRVASYAFNPDGSQLALGYCDEPRDNRSNPRHYQFYCDGTAEILLVDALSGEEQARLPVAETPLSLAFHPERPILAAGLANRDIELWDLGSQETFRTLSHSSKYTGVVDLAFSPDGTMLVSEGDSALQLWNWENPPFLQDTIPSAAGITFSPDGRWMVTMHLAQSRAGANRIRLYDLPYTGHFAEWPPLDSRRFAFLPDSLHLLGQYSTAVQVWDTQSGEHTAEYTYDMLGESVYLSLPNIVTPEGGLLWSIYETQPDSADSACGPLLWDPLAGKGAYARLTDDACLDWFQGPTGASTVSPDGRLLAELNQSYGQFLVRAVDPSSPAVAPVCMGACDEP